MFTETRTIENLGDNAFFGFSDDFDAKTIRVLIGNMTVTVTDKAMSSTSSYLSSEKEMRQLIDAILSKLT